MKKLSEFVLEKLILQKGKGLAYSYADVDNYPPSSKDKAEAALNVLKERYGDIFPELKILRSNNIGLGKIDNKIAGIGMYDDSTFTLYLNTDFNDGYLMRRSWGGMYANNTAKFIGDKPKFNSLEDLLDKFDSLLMKRGYNLNKK